MSITIMEWRDRNTGTTNQLPAAPLAQIIQRDLTRLLATEEAYEGTSRAFKSNARFPGLRRLADHVGVDQRLLHRIASGERAYVSVETADKYMCATGRHLRDLWPAYYDEPA